VTRFILTFSVQERKPGLFTPGDTCEEQLLIQEESGHTAYYAIAAAKVRLVKKCQRRGCDPATLHLLDVTRRK
jgi:hypothetical protein